MMLVPCDGSAKGSHKTQCFAFLLFFPSSWASIYHRRLLAYRARFSYRNDLLYAQVSTLSYAIRISRKTLALLKQWCQLQHQQKTLLQKKRLRKIATNTGLLQLFLLCFSCILFWINWPSAKSVWAPSISFTLFFLHKRAICRCFSSLPTLLSDCLLIDCTLHKCAPNSRPNWVWGDLVRKGLQENAHLHLPLFYIVILFLFFLGGMLQKYKHHHQH